MSRTKRTHAVRLGLGGVFLAAAAATVAPAGAQDPPPPQPADALLARAATSGWTGIVAIEATGTLAAGGREMAFHLWRQSGDRFRVELTHRGEKQTFVVQAGSGWIQAGTEDPVSLAANQVWERLSWADVFARFPDFYRRYPRRDVEPTRTLLGKPVRPVRLWPRSGYPYLYYVDETSGRIVGGVRQFYDGEEDAVREALLYYGDFREVAPGVEIAFTVESDEGTYAQTLELREVAVRREPLPDELFVPAP